jgi:hypothetical protein
VENSSATKPHLFSTLNGMKVHYYIYDLFIVVS